MKWMIITIFSINLVLSCNNKKVVSKDFVRTFEGKIDTQYSILMKLTSNEGKLNGSYFYTNKGTDIKLSGEIDENNNVTIREFDNSGSQTGVFKGKLKETKIEGTWASSADQKEKSFIVIESNSQYNAVKSQTNKEALSGKYLMGVNSIEVIVRSGEQIDVLICFASENCAMACQRGTLQKKSGYTFVGSVYDELDGSESEGNKIHLIFSGKKATLSSVTPTEAWLGPHCNFAGTYER